MRFYPALLTYMLGELHSFGIRRVWIGADASNLASQKGFVLAGFQPVVDLLVATAGEEDRMWVRGCPGASAQAVEDARWALFGDTVP
jgi:hypothetical protein